MFQYLTFKHASDSRPRQAPCTVHYRERLFGLSEEARGQAYPCLCFQSVLTHPNRSERQAGLAGHGFAFVRAEDSPAPLGVFPFPGSFLRAGRE